MTSPFLKASTASRSRSPMATVEKEVKSALNNPLAESPVFAPAVTAKQTTLPAVMSEDDIQSTGAAAGQQIKTVASQVLKHQRANNGDELSNRLNALVKETKQLDPNSMKNSTGLKKLWKRVLGIKEDIFEQFDTIDGRINVLVNELNEDLKREKDGQHQLRNLREQAGHYALALNRDIELLSANLAREQETFDNIPEDEVEARGDKRATMDLIETRINDLAALRLLMIQFGQRVKGMEEVGRQLIRASNNVLTNVIPAYTAAFSAYVHSMRQKKAAEALNNTIDEFNNAIALGGELASANRVEAARLANRQVLSIETLEREQATLLKDLEAINEINNNARQERIEYITRVGELEDGIVQTIRTGIVNKGA